MVRPTPRPAGQLLGQLSPQPIRDLQLVDPRDVSGGRTDTVIIKDVTNASNCAVVPNTAGNAVGANTLVTAFNGALGLRRAGAGARHQHDRRLLGLRRARRPTIANPSAPLRACSRRRPGRCRSRVSTGVQLDLSGNELPQAPNWKFSAGVQYTIRFGNGMTLVPRADFTYTGSYSARSFNRPIDRVDGYEVINAQIQLNGEDERWFVRAFVQNLTGNDAITGQYVTDQSSGLFTNAFTLEPRRYGRRRRRRGSETGAGKGA